MNNDNPKMIAAIEMFPGRFGLRAFPGDIFRISHQASYMGDNGKPMLYTQRYDGNTWVDFAKGSVEELSRNVVPL